MADIGVQQHWLVDPTTEVKEMWKLVKMQELKSRIARHTQDIEDLKRGKIVDLQAKIKMLELELRHLSGIIPGQATVVK